MLYLMIVLVVAVAGITRLYLMHRRERSQLNTIDGFRESLDKIGWHTTPRRVAARPDIRARALARTNTHRVSSERVVSRAHRATRPSAGRRTSSSTRLDPARREAAKRRLEARRRGSLRIPG